MKNIAVLKKNECLDKQQDYQWDADDQYAQEKFVRRTQKSNFQGLNRGNWTQEEDAQMAVFMELNFDIFTNKKKRKDSKIFLLFSKIIQNRNPPQCRSHFQKKMKKFKTVLTMINFYKNSLGFSRYNQLYEDLKTKQLLREKIKEQPLQLVETLLSEESLKNELKVEEQLPSDLQKSDLEKYTNDSHQSQEQEFIGFKQYLKAFCMI